MTDLRTDILENLTSARDPLTAEHVYLDAITWPLANGGKRRVTLSPLEVDELLAELVDEGVIEQANGGYRLRREVPKEEKQLSLF